MVDGFTRQFGEDPRRLDELDPRWLDYQAQVFTSFVQQANASLQPGQKLSVMVPGNEADLRRWGLDVAGWVRQGLVADVYPVGQKFNAANTHYDVPEALDYAYFEQLPGRGSVRIIPTFYTWTLYHRDRAAYRRLIRSCLNRRSRRQNISSVSTTSWKPKRRDLVTSDITSQSQPNT